MSAGAEKRVDDWDCAYSVADVLERKLALPKAERVTPSRLVLLQAHVATNGKGCELSSYKRGMLTMAERDAYAVELYRKLTGDEITGDKFILAEKTIVAKKRASGTGGRSGACCSRTLRPGPSSEHGAGS